MFRSFASDQVHNTVTCDLCSTHPISGPRFICLNCPNFDVCRNCYRPGEMNHAADHHFLLVRQPSPEFILTQPCSLIQTQNSTTHAGITCDLCRSSPLEGIRIKCCSCPDFDVCAACIPRLAQTETHNPAHIFLLLHKRPSVRLGPPELMIASRFIPAEILQIQQQSRAAGPSQTAAAVLPEEYKYKELQIGDAIHLSGAASECLEVSAGPLVNGSHGVIVEITSAECPFKVRLLTGSCGYYSPKALRFVARPGVNPTIYDAAPGLCVVRGKDWSKEDIRGKVSAAGVFIGSEEKVGLWRVLWPDGSTTSHNLSNAAVKELEYAPRILSDLPSVPRIPRLYSYVIPRNGLVETGPAARRVNPGEVGLVKDIGPEGVMVMNQRGGVFLYKMDEIISAPRPREIVSAFSARVGFNVMCKQQTHSYVNVKAYETVGTIIDIYAKTETCLVRWSTKTQVVTTHSIGCEGVFDLVYAPMPFNFIYQEAPPLQFDVGELVVSSLTHNEQPGKTNPGVDSHGTNERVGIVKKANYLNGSYMVHFSHGETECLSHTLSIFNPITVTMSNISKGRKVIRGPNWAFEDRDGGLGSVGIIKDYSKTHAVVQWGSGPQQSHSYGQDGKYELYYAPTTQEETNIVDPASASIQFTAAEKYRIGMTVTLSSNYNQYEDAAFGPMEPFKSGIVIGLDLSSTKSVRVQCGNADPWWYSPLALDTAPSAPQATEPLTSPKVAPPTAPPTAPSTTLQSPARIAEGSRVMLSLNYRQCGDAAGGPLRPGDVGTVIKDDRSSKPYQVRSVGGRTWWYTAAALVLEGSPGAASTSPTTRITEGSRVILSPTYQDCDDAAGGPLRPGDVGTVVEDDGSPKPYQVRAQDGRTWWYTAAALVLEGSPGAASASQPPTTRITEGNRVILSPTYQDCDDAAGGPLRPGDVGVVIKDDGSSKPFQVRAQDGRTWWYTAAALVLDNGIDTTDRSSTSRITEGSRVILSPTYQSCGDAGNGPLRPGDVGVVVKDDGSSVPFQVRAQDGRTWWYRREALVSAPN